MQEYLTHSEAETEQAGADFARALPDGKVVAMYGELGSGKTAFVRGHGCPPQPDLQRPV